MTLISDITSLLDVAAGDLQARKDYGSVQFSIAQTQQSLTAQEAVSELLAYKQALLVENAQTSTDNTKTTVDSTETQNLIAAIINSNLLMSKMGQLNTDRTIEPTTALANNKVLTTLQSDIMLLTAGGDEKPYWNGGTNWQHPADSVELSWTPK